MPYFDARSGLLDRAVFASHTVYRRELESIFQRNWLFVGLERRLTTPGTFVAASAGAEPLLVWRGTDGTLRAFVNRCPRSMAPVCDDDAGVAAALRCDCHGTLYASDGRVLAGTGPALNEAAGLDSHRGLLFATLDPCAPGLTAYLSGATPLLDQFAGDADSCAAAPLRWMLDANWKLPAEAFAATTVFPNLSFDADSGCLLVWHPRAPNRTEVHLYCLVDQAADAGMRRHRQRAGVCQFGPGSVTMQHASDAWSSLTAQAARPLARRVPVAFPLPDEASQRDFYEWWQARLAQRPNARRRQMVAVS